MLYKLHKQTANNDINALDHTHNNNINNEKKEVNSDKYNKPPAL